MGNGIGYCCAARDPVDPNSKDVHRRPPAPEGSPRTANCAPGELLECESHREDEVHTGPSSAEMNFGGKRNSEDEVDVGNGTARTNHNDACNGNPNEANPAAPSDGKVAILQSSPPGQIKDPLANSLHSVTSWYNSEEATSRQVSGNEQDPLAKSFSDWYADGQPPPNARTDRTEVLPMAQSLNAWYAADDCLEEERSISPNLKRRKSLQEDAVDTWYADGMDQPSARTALTEFHPIDTSRKQTFSAR